MLPLSALSARECVRVGALGKSGSLPFDLRVSVVRDFSLCVIVVLSCWPGSVQPLVPPGTQARSAQRRHRPVTVWLALLDGWVGGFEFVELLVP